MLTVIGGHIVPVIPGTTPGSTAQLVRREDGALSITGTRRVVREDGALSYPDLELIRREDGAIIWRAAS